jgi:SAM-dependent methyltransferase
MNIAHTGDCKDSHGRSYAFDKCLIEEKYDMKYLLRKCPVCGCEGGQVLRHINLNTPGKWQIPIEYDVVSCDKCGMTFADTPVTDEALGWYYRNCSKYENYAQINGETAGKEDEFFYDVISKYAKKNMRILDMGCATGGKLITLKSHGFKNLTGIEIDTNSVLNLKKYAIEGYAASIYDEPDKDLLEKYDFVYSSMVFEHLLYPNKAVKNLVKYLKPAGTLFLFVPNALGFPIYDREIPNYFNQEHINYFTPNSIDTLMMLNGFERYSPDADANMESPSMELTIFAAYRRVNAIRINSEHHVIRDISGEKAVLKYFSEIKDKEKRELEMVRKAVDESGRIVIWGAGSLMRHILSEEPDIIPHVKYFVDNDSVKQRMEFFGKKVYPINKVKENPEVDIVICIMIAPTTIKEQIDKLGIKNKIINLAAEEWR